MRASSELSEHESKRQRLLVEAARACFLRFGYQKTSLDDIAREAGLSRPLIYRSFKNKADIFAAVFEHTFEHHWPVAEAAASGRGSKRDKLLRVYDVLLIEPWEEISQGPMLADYYKALERLVPSAKARHEKLKLRTTESILGDRELAQVFILSVEGLLSDLPSVRTLRRRLELLVDRFVS